MQSFYCNIMDLEYRLHFSAYLAKCINKAQPALACEGQCILMQKIGEKEKQEAEKNLVAHEYVVLYVHKEYTAFNAKQPDGQMRENPFTPYLISYGFEYNALLYRPPIS